MIGRFADGLGQGADLERLAGEEVDSRVPVFGNQLGCRQVPAGERDGGLRSRAAAASTASACAMRVCW